MENQTETVKAEAWAAAMAAIRLHAERRCKSLGLHNRYQEHISPATGPANGLPCDVRSLFEKQ